MKALKAIQQTLQDDYKQSLSLKNIQLYQKKLAEGQKQFSISQQQALMIKLINSWENRKNEKIIIETNETNPPGTESCVIVFGVLSVDWPGLLDTCTGVVHEMGWNIYFGKGISLDIDNEHLGVVIIGVLTDRDTGRKALIEQREIIIKKINQAAIGTTAKAYLLAEEFRKLEIYSQVISLIEQLYDGDDLENIIGMNGEAVKYFAARSRDYIENRKNVDIARQIILNHTFITTAHKSGSAMELDISNFDTNTEGTFTGITVAGPAHTLYLEDCLKTIELSAPRFQMKHNKEFTTTHGISLFRIEFVDSSGHPLTSLDQQRLRDAFSRLVLNKQRDRAQWIESIGGFEQYARAIIPLLVKEAQISEKSQVYQSVVQTTDLFIDFKIIIVVIKVKGIRRKLVTDTVNELDKVYGFHILAVKPPKTFGQTEVFIIDLRAYLTEIENVETIYDHIREKVYKALGEFRDFDEGMRTLDTAKLKAIRQLLKNIDKNIIREFYYSIEAFFRISASGDEIAAMIRIAVKMLHIIEKSEKPLNIISQNTGPLSKEGKMIPNATLICVSYPHEMYFLNKILTILEPYDVTLSRLEKMGKDILICRIAHYDKALTKKELDDILLKHVQMTNEKQRHGE